MNDRSTFLFATPSFLEGVGRIADISGSLSEYNTTSTAEGPDMRALRNDWRVVGDDLRAALKAFREELEHSY